MTFNKRYSLLLGINITGRTYHDIYQSAHKQAHPFYNIIIALGNIEAIWRNHTYHTPPCSWTSDHRLDRCHAPWTPSDPPEGAPHQELRHGHHRCPSWPPWVWSVHPGSYPTHLACRRAGIVLSPVERHKKAFSQTRNTVMSGSANKVHSKPWCYFSLQSWSVFTIGN